LKKRNGDTPVTSQRMAGSTMTPWNSVEPTTTAMKWPRLPSRALFCVATSCSSGSSQAERRQAHDPADDHQAQLLQFADQVADVAVAFAADDQRNAEKRAIITMARISPLASALNGFWNRPRMNCAM
jgi:hypothetical protein